MSAAEWPPLRLPQSTLIPAKAGIQQAIAAWHYRVGPGFRGDERNPERYRIAEATISARMPIIAVYFSV